MKPGLRHILPWLVLAAACCVPAQRAGVERPVSEPAPVRVRLLFAGDVMQHFPQVTAARCGDGFDYRGVFAYLRRRFHAADLVVVNLETTLTRTDRYTGYPCFRSPVALADALRDAGVDVAVLANNHCCDGGAAGVRTTVAELGRCGILHTGVFTDSLDRAANNPLWVERYGVRFALLNYTYGTNGIPVPAGVEVNLIDTADIYSNGLSEEILGEALGGAAGGRGQGDLLAGFHGQHAGQQCAVGQRQWHKGIGRVCEKAQAANPVRMGRHQAHLDA